MDIDLESDLISHVLIKPKGKTQGNNTNKVYQHLSDHNYINPNKVNKNLAPKQMKKQLIITELKAIYNCVMCGYRTMSREALIKHKCTTKPNQVLYNLTKKKIPNGYEECTKCNFSTRKKSNLITHMMTHVEGLKKPCTDCKILKPNVDTAFKCQNCNYTTKNPTSLKIHMHIHSRGTPYKCTECPFSGQSLKELIKHYDATKNLRCDCGYTTHLKQQMASHRRTHTQEKPFSCGVCSFATSDRAGLHRHMKKKHNYY